MSSDVPGNSFRTLLKLLIVIVMHRHEQLCVVHAPQLWYSDTHSVTSLIVRTSSAFITHHDYLLFLSIHWQSSGTVERVMQSAADHMRPPTHVPSTALLLRTSMRSPQASYSRCMLIIMPGLTSHENEISRPLPVSLVLMPSTSSATATLLTCRYCATDGIGHGP